MFAPNQSYHIIEEYQVLWTAQKHQKSKRWQDGKLRLHTFNNRLVLTDNNGTLVSDKFHIPTITPRYDNRDPRGSLEDDEEIQFEAHLVTVQDFLGWRKGEVNLCPIEEARKRKKEEIQARAAMEGRQSPERRLQTPGRVGTGGCVRGTPVGGRGVLAPYTPVRPAGIGARVYPEPRHPVKPAPPVQHTAPAPARPPAGLSKNSRPSNPPPRSRNVPQQQQQFRPPVNTNTRPSAQQRERSSSTPPPSTFESIAPQRPQQNIKSKPDTASKDTFPQNSNPPPKPKPSEPRNNINPPNPASKPAQSKPNPPAPSKPPQGPITISPDPTPTPALPRLPTKQSEDYGDLDFEDLDDFQFPEVLEPPDSIPESPKRKQHSEFPLPKSKQDSPSVQESSPPRHIPTSSPHGTASSCFPSSPEPEPRKPPSPPPEKKFMTPEEIRRRMMGKPTKLTPSIERDPPEQMSDSGRKNGMRSVARNSASFTKPTVSKPVPTRKTRTYEDDMIQVSSTPDPVETKKSNKDRTKEDKDGEIEEQPVARIRLAPPVIGQKRPMLSLQGLNRNKSGQRSNSGSSVLTDVSSDARNEKRPRTSVPSRSNSGRGKGVGRKSSGMDEYDDLWGGDALVDFVTPPEAR